MKKLLSITLVFIMLFCAALPTYACGINRNESYDDVLPELQSQFVYGESPETDGYVLDYRYFSPVEDNDTTKYPLVIWLHGMGDGGEDGLQVTKSDIAFWASDDFQARFSGSKGAFILAPRSPEDKGIFWSDEYVYVLRVAIDDFIAKNKDNIDVSRIYIGGYSMGGKMTLKMAIAYPELFAAAFPICPALNPNDEQASLIADMPIWLTSGVPDPLVNYVLSVKPTWKTIIENSNVPADCRFSTLKLVKFPSGNPTSSSHHSWFSVNYDMFSADNGDYPYMSTVDGLGNKVTLTFPNGMISWLSSHTSDYNGAPATDKGNDEAYEEGKGYLSMFDKLLSMF